MSLDEISDYSSAEIEKMKKDIDFDNKKSYFENDIKNSPYINPRKLEKLKNTDEYTDFPSLYKSLGFIDKNGYFINESLENFSSHFSKNESVNSDERKNFEKFWEEIYPETKSLYFN